MSKIKVVNWSSSPSVWSQKHNNTRISGLVGTWEAYFAKNAQGSNSIIWQVRIFYSNFMGVVPKWCDGGGGGEPKSSWDGGGWNESLNGKLAAAAAAAHAAAAAEVGSNLSFTILSSCFFKARRSLARRFWNQIFT